MRHADRSSPQTVLIVDDDPETRSILCAYARELGLVPEDAENGASALARARQAPPTSFSWTSGCR